MKTFRRYILLLLVAALTLSLFGCNGKKALESTKEDLTVVKKIGGIDVPLEMYRYVALNLKKTYEDEKSADIWLGESGKALVAEINEEINRTLIQLYTVPAIAEEYGIDINDPYVLDTLEVKMKEIYETYGNDYKKYADDIAAYYMNDSVYRFFIRNDILAEEIIAKMIALGEIPGDVESVRQLLLGDECVRVKQVLIITNNGETDEENMALAESILERINSGENFEKLIKEYGEDINMFNNDSGYYVIPGVLYEEFELASFDLEIGEVSGIVKTPAGLSIIKRYEKDEGYIEKYKQTLAQDYISGRYNLALEKFSSALTAEDTDKAANYSIFNIK